MAELGKKPLWPFTLDTQSPQAQGLVGWWPGGVEQGNGNRLFDMSGRNNHGTLTNFATPFTPTSGWAAGYQGGKGALRCDGTDDFVSVADAAVLTNPACSVSVLVNFAAVGIVGVVSKRIGSANSDEFNLLYRNDAGDGGFGAGFYFRTNGESTGLARYVVTASLNTWYHVCATFNGTTKAVYVNGILGTSGSGAAIANGNSNLTFGSLNSAGSNFLSGAFEEPRYYNRALNAGEVAAIYQNPWAMRWQKTRSYFVAPAAAAGNRRRRVLISGGGQ